MGNFYANLVVKSAETARVSATLERHRRRAYVASIHGATYVYDERCDEQRLDELTDLATLLSRETAAPVLASCNHDDDVLWLAFADGGDAVQIYDSSPGYFDGGQKPPSVGDLSPLCAAFGAQAQRAELEAVMRAPHSQFGVEVDRHSRLLQLLGLPSHAGLLGYSYVARGELSDLVDGATLSAVGGAPELGQPAAARVPPRPVDPSLAEPPDAPRLRRVGAALALTEVDLPDAIAKIVGQPRTNGLVVLMQLQAYIATNRLVRLTPSGSGVSVVPDATLAAFLGANELSGDDFVDVLAERLGVWQRLSDDARHAIETWDPSMQRRIAAAMRAFEQQLAAEGPSEPL